MNMGSYNCCSVSSQKLAQLSSGVSLLKIVTEESRLKILCILRGGDHCVCEITEHLEMSQSLVSHHISDLKKFRMVTGRKEGVRTYYSLTDKGRNVIDLLFKISEKRGRNI